MKFSESDIAHQYLDGLKGIEIGGAAHNPFGLDTINVDINESPIFKEEQIRLCGEAMKVDVVSAGDKLPFKDKSYDFVISSHVIEYFYNPIDAIREWERVATMYIFMIVPHKMRTFDRDKPLTTVRELIKRKSGVAGDKHWSFWDMETFMELMVHMGLNVVYKHNVDDKVGNGFTIVIKLF
jgi:SAM-dependent methyltransferase